MRRPLVSLLMVLLALSVNPVIGPSSGAAYSDPPAVTPEEVGLASSRLAHIRSVMNRHVAEKQIPGAAGLIARRGKIAYQEASGQWPRRICSPGYSPPREGAEGIQALDSRLQA